MKLDKYARDSISWCESAIQDHLAARILFTSGNPVVFFTAATIAHHALEMYLKSALIVAGFTIFDPRKIKDLDASEALTKDRCAWGHNLPTLSQRLANEQTAFDLRAQLEVPGVLFLSAQPMTLDVAFEHFEPFFEEVRYPREYENFRGVGTDEKVILDAVVDVLRPFLPDIASCPHWGLLLN